MQCALHEHYKKYKKSQQQPNHLRSHINRGNLPPPPLKKKKRKENGLPGELTFLFLNDSPLALSSPARRRQTLQPRKEVRLQTQTALRPALNAGGGGGRQAVVEYLDDLDSRGGTDRGNLVHNTSR